MFRRIAVLVLTATVALSACAANDLSSISGATPLTIDGLRNTFRVTGRIFSGSQPDSEPALAALARLGIKTIVSVDGSKPDVEAAHKFGLKYVHLPIGYGRVPLTRVAEFTKVVSVMSGPFYVHCRHGMYRGPAAVALMCESAECWSPSQALAWLGQAGGSVVYPGLYRSVADFQKPREAELKAATEFPEIAKSSLFVKRMVLMDQHFSRLKEAQRSGWIKPGGQVEVATRRDAVIVWDQLRKLLRTDPLDGRPNDFYDKLLEAQKAAEELNNLLSAAGPRTQALDSALDRSAQTCTACHRRFRNQ